MGTYIVGVELQRILTLMKHDDDGTGYTVIPRDDCKVGGDFLLRGGS